jgi:hypothetical protein
VSKEPPAPRPATSGDFRKAIDKAVDDGVAKEDMVLHLTLRDEAYLKKDRALPVEDLSFAGGEMRFLGVKVVKGGVANSHLELPGESPTA